MDKETLGTMPIKSLLLKLAIPSITAQLINALYNIVDRMYIGRIDGVGSLALAGLGIAYPLIIIIMAFVALVGTGGAPRAAIKMGENDWDGAEKILGNALSATFICSISLMIIFGIFKEPLLYLFGATDNTITFANDYFSIYLVGTMFVQFSLCLNAYVTAQGFTKISMRTTLIGAVVNIVLDPILIYGFDLGVKGAAYATVIAQFVSFAWITYFVLRGDSLLKVRKANLKIKKEIIISIMSLGMAPFIMQSTNSAVQFVLNSGLKTYGGADTDYLIGALAIFTSTMQFVSMPLTGLSEAAKPIMSFNYGAGKYDRVLNCFKITFTCSMINSMVFWLILMICPQIFVFMFTNDTQTFDFAVKYMPIYFFGIGIFGMQQGCQAIFVALGQAKKAMFFAMLRKIFILVPLAVIFPMFMGYEGVFYASPFADSISAIAAGITCYIFLKRHLFNKENSCHTVTN